MLGRTYLDSPSGADPLHYHRLRCCPEVMLVHAQTRPFTSPCQTAPLPSTGLIRFWESQRIWSRREGNMVMMYIIVQGCRPTLHADYH